MDELNPDQIKQMIKMLQGMLEPTKPKNIKKPKRINNKKITPSKINKFDEMAEKNMHKEDTIIDKKLNIYPPSPRARSYKPISVQCRVCGKKDSINPSLLHDSIDRYKCNKCSSSAG